MTIGIYSRVLKEEHIPYVVELIAQLSNNKISFFVFESLLIYYLQNYKYESSTKHTPLLS